jgi:hypothetical protein
MTGTRKLRRRSKGCAPPKPAVRAFLLAAWLALLIGCGGDGKTETRNVEPGVTETTVAQIARTLELNKRFREAKTEEERKAARRELIAHLKTRYSGIDGHVPPADIRARNAAFAALMTEWDPRGYDVEDLEAIAGRPSFEKETEVEYAFITEMGGAHWRFKGRPMITSVHFRGGE